MKKYIILFLTIFLLTSCSNKKQLNKYPKPILDDLDLMEIQAYRMTDHNHNTSKKNITKHLNYILNNIDHPFNSKKITKNIYYNSSYLINIVDKKGINTNNDIYNLSINIKDYLKNNNDTNKYNQILIIKNNIISSKQVLINSLYKELKNE